jgi:hypothetical protein
MVRPTHFFALLVLAALGCSACGSPFADHRPPDERWADKVCSALGEWGLAQTSGANSGELLTLRDEGHLSHSTMAAALRPGVAASPKLIAAIRAAGAPPVPDAASLSAELDDMVQAETRHLRRAYSIARDTRIPVSAAYPRIEAELAAMEGAEANRGIVNLRWYHVPSCQALV